MQMASTETETARTLLISWANQQDGWVRSVVSELLVTRSPVGRESLERALAVLLAEKGLALKPLEQPICVVEDKGRAAGKHADLRLRSLSGVSHVNALSVGQEIEFHPSLTILFGENASGKSGYCRILKRLANVRSAEEILDDIECGTPGTPTATIEYSLGSEQHELVWDGTAGVAPLGRVAVFDSRAVGLHVDDDLNYHYTPGDLVLFRLCHAALESVGKLLDEYMKGRAMDLSLSSSAFTRGTEVFMLFDSLGPGTDVERLKILGTFDDGSEENLRQLQLAVAALQPDNIDNKAKAASADIELFEEILSALDATIGFDVGAYNDAVDATRAAKEFVQQTTMTAFKDAAILGQMHESWRQFIDSAEEFIKATHQSDFPHDGDKCPYCQQQLSKAATQLIQRYRNLARSDGQKQLDSCVHLLEEFKAQLSAVAPESLQQKLATRMASVPGSSTVAETLTPALAAARTLSENVQAQQRLDNWTPLTGLAELRARIATTVTDAAQKLQAAQTEAKQRETELASRTATLKGLQDRQKLAQNLPTVLHYLEEARWETKAAAITKLFPTVLRSLTSVAKQASAVALHGDFETRFFVECERLRAPRLKLDFPGRKGEAARRKVVTGKHRVSDILSEGEQKVIALADFLAEASLQESSAPVVLDDPVNSLDYRRIYEVVARLTAISSKQQLVVFTHNIWFASLLLEQANRNCSFYQIRDDGRQKGMLSRETAPRTDSLSKLKAGINEKLEHAKSAEGATRQTLVESAYSSLRAWCEVAVERELLQGVVTRYQPMVRLTTLARIKPEALKPAIDAIVPVYERACRAIEAHSQPLETLNVRPTLDDLRSDWDIVQKALKSYDTA
jgi:AAA domain-containing protein